MGQCITCTIVCTCTYLKFPLFRDWGREWLNACLDLQVIEIHACICTVTRYSFSYDPCTCNTVHMYMYSVVVPCFVSVGGAEVGDGVLELRSFSSAFSATKQ